MIVLPVHVAPNSQGAHLPKIVDHAGNVLAVATSPENAADIAEAINSLIPAADDYAAPNWRYCDT